MKSESMKPLVRKLVRTVAGIFIVVPLAALSQTYPAKSVLVISQSQSGSPSDVALRLITNKMSANIGQQLVVEGRPAGRGTVASIAVKGAAPDGYSLLFGTPAGLVITRFMIKDLPVDSVKDFAPIAGVISTFSFLVVHPSVPVNTLVELIDYAKHNPGKLLYASTGVGSPFQFYGEAFKMATVISMREIPYNTGNASVVMNDFMAGRVQVYFPAYLQVRPNLGKMKVLAVLEDARYPALPDVPAGRKLAVIGVSMLGTIE